MTLSFDDKDTIFNTIPTSFQVQDVNGNNHNIEFKKIQVKQQQKLEYPCITIDWQRQGSRYMNMIPTFLRRTNEEEIWLEQPNISGNYEIVKGEQIVEIEFTATELNIFKFYIHTRKRYDTTSDLKISVFHVLDNKIIDSIIVRNSIIADNDWTEIELDIPLDFDFDYKIIIEESIAGSNPQGINITTDISGNTSYKISRKKEIDIHGGPETTSVIIESLAKDIPLDDDIFISGETIAEQSLEEIRTIIKRDWEDQIGTIRVLQIANIQNVTEDFSTEYIYRFRMEIEILYETIFEREVTYIREVILGEIELIN